MWTDEWSSSIPLAGVFAPLPAGADERGVQAEAGGEAGLVAESILRRRVTF